MGYYTKASDWEVAGVGGIAGGVGVAGGWFFFIFKSKSANVSQGCRFVGLGAGGGADLGKIGKAIKLIKHAPKLEKLFDVASYAAVSPHISFGKIEMDEPMSMYELHNNGGRLTMAGAAVGYGYTLMYITGASGIISSYFHSQSCHGGGIGFGAVGMTTLGFWFNNKP